MIKLDKEEKQICEHCSQHRLLSLVSLPDGRTLDLEQRTLPPFSFQEYDDKTYTIFCRLANGESELLKSETSKVSPGDILGLILSSENPARIGNQLNTSLQFNITVLKSGLNNLLSRFPNQQDALIERYTKFAGEFLTKILVEINSGERSQMPLNLFEGSQGRINARITIQYNIENVDGISLNELKDTICSGKFGRSYFHDPSRKMRNMLDKAYSGRTAHAMIDYVTHHPDPTWRRAFQGLSYLHFSDVVKWRSSRLDLQPEASEWDLDEETGEYVNIKGARETIFSIVKSRLEYPTSNEVEIEEYIGKLDKLVGELSNGDIQSSPAPFGGTYGTIIQSVYSPRRIDPIFDFIEHHPDDRVRQHFNDLKSHHLKYRTKMHDDDHAPDYQMARAVSNELFDILLQRKRENGGLDRIEDAPKHLSFKRHLQTPLLHGGRTIESIYHNVYSSLVHGVIDYLVNHPDPKTREHFQGLEPYHFRNISKRIYSSEHQPTNSMGWLEIGNNQNKYSWRNVGLAYRAITEAISIRLKAGESITDIFKTISFTSLSDVRGKFGNNFVNLLQKVFLRMDHNGKAVYNGEVMDLALGGYIHSQEFLRLIKLHPSINPWQDEQGDTLRRILLGLVRPSGGTIIRPHWSNNPTHNRMNLPESLWRAHYADINPDNK